MVVGPHTSESSCAPHVNFGGKIQAIKYMGSFHIKNGIWYKGKNSSTDVTLKKDKHKKPVKRVSS